MARETVNPLPVGSCKAGDCGSKSGMKMEPLLADGEKGEIIILGDTVSTGYFCQEELTGKAFFPGKRCEGISHWR